MKESFGEVFRSPVILLFPMFVLLEICYFKEFRSLKAYGFKRINSFFCIFHLLYFLMTIIYCFIWIGIENKGETMLGENIFVKSIKGLLYYTLSWLIYRSFYFLLYKAKKYELNISSIFLVLTIIYIFIILVEYYTMPMAWSIFHSDSLLEYTRIRLLTEESSWTGWVLLLLFTGSLINVEGKYKKMTIFSIVLFFLLFTATSSSKQYIITVIVAILLYYAFIVRSKKKIIYLPLLLIFSVLISIYVIPYLDVAMEGGSNYGSLVTRTTSFLAGIKSAIDHPLGTGGIGYFYLVEYQKDIPDLFIGMNINELIGLGIDDMGGVSTQSTLGQMLLFLGILGFFLLYNFYKTLIISTINIGKPILIISVIYFIIASLSAPVLEGQPDCVLFIALITYYNDCKNKSDEQII